MRNLLCLFGFHEWAKVVPSRQPCRVCYHCNREQMGLKVSSYSPVVWFNARKAP